MHVANVGLVRGFKLFLALSRTNSLVALATDRVDG